jgi:lipoprotein signal peptidase
MRIKQKPTDVTFLVWAVIILVGLALLSVALGVAPLSEPGDLQRSLTSIWRPLSLYIQRNQGAAFGSPRLFFAILSHVPTQGFLGLTPCGFAVLCA